MTQIKIKNTKENYIKIVRMVQHYEDMVICSECETDRINAKKELSYWKNHLKELNK